MLESELERESEVDERPSEPAEVLPEGSGALLLGVVVCFLLAAALATAAFQSTAVLARPLAGTGFVLGLVGALAVGFERPGRVLLPLGAGLGSGLTLLAAWFAPALLGPGYEAGRVKSDYDPEAVRLVPLQLTSGGAETIEPGGYADASRSAVQQGNVRAQITSATVAPVQVVDAKRRYTKQPLLAVKVRVQHLGHGDRFRFVHWGTTGERVAPPAVATADGRPLRAASLGRDVPVGVTFGEDVFPGKAVDDVLLFEPPPDLVGPVRIELPAEAWAGHGTFRFQIPTSMIVIQRGTKKAPR